MQNDQMKKLVIILGAVVVGIIAIVGIGSMMSEPKITKLDYKGLEEKIKEVGQKYFEENSSLLPKNDGETKEVSVDDLVKLEMMSPISDLLNEDATCTGKAVVKNVSGKYAYTGLIDCGDKYVTSNLYEKIINDNPLVTSGNGLYLQNDEYVFRGENLNNYVEFANAKWLIIKVDKDSDIKLLQIDKEGERVSFDDRYNSEKESTVGKNDFSISRMRDSLNEIYNSDKFNDEEKSLIVAKPLCIGSRNENDNNNDGTIECSNLTSENMYIGLIQVNEYLNASLDFACKTIDDSECQNYNYLASTSPSTSWWTITPVKGNTYQTYYIESYGSIEPKNCSSTAAIRPVIYISKDVMFDSGKGTEEEPYIIK